MSQEIDDNAKALLKAVADFEGSFENFKGAHNFRFNCHSVSRTSTKNIKIEPLEKNEGLKIEIAAGTKGEKVAIPACVTKPGINDIVKNDFYVGEGAQVEIIAGCGIHTLTGEEARHSGVHRFFLSKNARVIYTEKHVGMGKKFAFRKIDPVTEFRLEEGAYLEMNMQQLGGVDSSLRKTSGVLKENATLIIKESILTEGEQSAQTEFDVSLDGKNSSVNLISRSVARGKSNQKYRSRITGNALCYGHSECDAILAEEGKVAAAPELLAACKDAQLIHEAAIGKISGEQILKLQTLGLSEKEAEDKIIEGFLK